MHSPGAVFFAPGEKPKAASSTKRDRVTADEALMRVDQ